MATGDPRDTVQYSFNYVTGFVPPISVCPNCGYCPHCGRRDFQQNILPVYPLRPYITWGDTFIPSSSEVIVNNGH